MRLILILLTLTPSFSLAENWKFRAREHYEIHTVRSGDQETKFKGFSNTINFWYEKPFNYSLGLAFGPIIGSAKPKTNDESFQLGSKIQLYILNFEFKFYPTNRVEGLFLRLGVGGAQLRTNGIIGNKNGYNGYAGIGYEFWVAQRFTLALECAMRKSQLQDGASIDTLTPSLGIHFYKDF